jgi:hypothetical protein
MASMGTVMSIIAARRWWDVGQLDAHDTACKVGAALAVNRKRLQAGRQPVAAS